ncbi:hypothetical protein LTR56_024187 [Elasticomyces elasticus]|nr:hypothetical protein LTR56_024187 [Elasticomyces elasticus]KAK3640580.1 hypothetical protein LTR22_016956 [Elasticomyces elasticus]KAK4910212.1 hypothetical protein LTR49_021103 [Elasticomyces elasticus]
MSWGYTAGAYYRNASAFGSLTLGGYDSSRFTRNNASFDVRNSTSRDLLLTLDSISYNSFDSQPLLLGAPIDVFIDSLVTELYLPVTVCQAFETAFGLQWDSTTERYLINGTTHNNLLAQNPTFNMTFSQPGNGTATILLPYAAFDLNVTQPLVNTTSRYFPLKQAQNSTQYTLGRTFLQEAYIITDYERRNFSVYQAVSDGGPEELVAINSPEPQAAKHRSGLTGGAIAGIVIAITVALALVVGAVFWFRRQWRLAIGDTIDEKHAETEQSSPVSRYEVDGESGRYELNAQEQRKAELDGSYQQIKDRPLPAIKVHEMRANETPAVELEAIVRVHISSGEVPLKASFFCRFTLSQTFFETHYNLPPLTMASPSRLLALPRELRDVIYAFAVISGEQTLRIKQQPPSRGHSQFTSSSQLLLVCKQVSAEYVESFAKNILSPGHEEVHIALTVLDFDVADLQALIQSLAPGQVDHLKAKCRLRVRLVFLEKIIGLERNDNLRLKSWAHFCNSKGLRAAYEVDQTAVRRKWEGDDAYILYELGPKLPEEIFIRYAICDWIWEDKERW